jgi:hypothetical protein
MTPHETVQHSLAMPAFFRAATAAGYSDRAAAILYRWLYAYTQGCTPVPDHNGQLAQPEHLAEVLFGTHAANEVNRRCEALDLDAFTTLLAEVRDLVGLLDSDDIRVAWVEFLNTPDISAAVLANRIQANRGARPGGLKGG